MVGEDEDLLALLDEVGDVLDDRRQLGLGDQPAQLAVDLQDGAAGDRAGLLAALDAQLDQLGDLGLVAVGGGAGERRGRGDPQAALGRRITELVGDVGEGQPGDDGVGHLGVELVLVARRAAAPLVGLRLEAVEEGERRAPDLLDDAHDLELLQQLGGDRLHRRAREQRHDAGVVDLAGDLTGGDGAGGLAVLHPVRLVDDEGADAEAGELGGPALGGGELRRRLALADDGIADDVDVGVGQVGDLGAADDVGAHTGGELGELVAPVQHEARAGRRRRPGTAPRGRRRRSP